jgi:6-phosphofructokinase 1
MTIHRIAVLTSGGDAPGMNAALRAVARAGLERGWEIRGVRDGYAGLVDASFQALSARAVSGIVQRGGTILGTARFPEFADPAVQQRAIEVIRRERIDALVVIGGDGSQTGALALAKHGVQVVGIASTIDNDLAGIDITLGVDTALDVALESIDRLKVTAASHHRVSVVETMGRTSGYLALAAGVAGGAEAIVIPEDPCDETEVLAKIQAAFERGQAHALVVIAEGARLKTSALVSYLTDALASRRIGVRSTILGHTQRGGAPGAFDRLLGSRSGVAAVWELAEGGSGKILGLVHGHMVATPMAEIVGRPRPLDPELVAIDHVLTR